MKLARGIIAALVAMTALGGCSQSQRLETAAVARTILDAVPVTDSVEPDVVLLAARAQVELHRADPSGPSEQTLRTWLQRLEDLAVHREDGELGWGLSYAWDAFSDGSENPADTVYSYTTAAAGLAFLDAFEVLSDEHHLAVAEAAAQALLSATCCHEEGGRRLIWYSDQPSDHRADYLVYNVNGLTLALLSRLDHLSGADTYGQVRADILSSLLDAQGAGLPTADIEDVPVAPSNWRYMAGRERPNDLIHETFIIEGLLEADSGASRRAALNALDGVWRTHLQGTGEPSTITYTRGSQGWGPPAALFMLAITDPARAESLTIHLVEERAWEELGDRGALWYAMAFARHARVSG